MKTIQIVLPDHTEEKLGELQEHYLIPPEWIVQKVVIDRVDEIHDAVVLEPIRKEQRA